jgi:hypothetical protein
MKTTSHVLGVFHLIAAIVLTYLGVPLPITISLSVLTVAYWVAVLVLMVKTRKLHRAVWQEEKALLDFIREGRPQTDRLELNTLLAQDEWQALRHYVDDEGIVTDASFVVDAYLSPNMSLSWLSVVYQRYLREFDHSTPRHKGLESTAQDLLQFFPDQQVCVFNTTYFPTQDNAHHALLCHQPTGVFVVIMYMTSADVPLIF